MIKQTIKALVPKRLIAYRHYLIKSRNMLYAYKYDFNRYNNHSRTNGNNTSEKLIGEIITIYHVIEKGLTMPDVRLGFGKDRIIQLCELCIQHIDTYGLGEKQLEHAIQVILEYEKFHKTNRFKLEPVVISAIEKTKTQQNRLSPCEQKHITKNVFLKNHLDNFHDFSNSRASVRNFTSENIPSNKILEVLELARNTPSACNRQSWRTYIFSEKKQIQEILEVQGGNRGFGHLANKLIVVTGEQGVFSGVAERNQVFIDGGMYAMNLLYSLHYHEIAACILNCSHSPAKDKKMHNLCKINESEVFVSMIVCGIPPESFMIANSKRHVLNKTNTII